MIRGFFRLLGLWLLAAFVIIVTVDGTRTIAGNALSVSRVAETWAILSPTSLQGARGVIERFLGASAWDPATVILLDLPTALVLLVLAAVFLFAGRPKRDMLAV